MIYFFTFVNIVNYLDRFIVAAVLPRVSADLGLNNTQSALLFSAFMLGYFVFSPVFGYLGDRFARPRLMALGIVVWSLGSIATGLCSSFWPFFAVRIVVGIGEASFGTIAPGYLKDRICDPIKLNSQLAIFYSAIPIGAALGYVFGGTVTAYMSWEYSFVLGGVPGLVCAPFLLRYRDSHRSEISRVGLVEGVRGLWRVALLRYIKLGYVLNTAALGGIAVFVPSYGEQVVGMGLREVNQYFGIILLLAGFAGTFFGGRLASHVARSAEDKSAMLCRYSGVVSLLAVIPVFMAFSTESAWLFLSACFIAELLVFASVAPVNSAIVLSAPPHLVTLAQGVTIFLIHFFGDLPSPVLVGAVADQMGLPVGMQLLTLALLASGVVWVYGPRFAKLTASQ